MLVGNTLGYQIGESERVCGLADLAKNFIRIMDFNNNFSRSADPINVMDLDLGKRIVRITDSKPNCSRTADLSMVASRDLALKLRGLVDPVAPFHPPKIALISGSEIGSPPSKSPYL